MEDITARDEALFKIIRARVGEDRNAICSDFFLKRCLISDKYELEKVVPRINSYISFSKYLNACQGIDDTNTFLYGNYLPLPPTPPLQDLEANYVIQIILIGKIDWYGLLNSVPSSTLIRFGARVIEEAVERLKRAEEISGKRSEGIVWILDFEDFNYDCFHLKIWNGPLGDFFLFILSQYGEVTRQIFLLNCSWFAYRCWKLCQSIIPKSIVSQKMIFLSASNWAKELKAGIDVTSLPMHWGGSDEEHFQNYVRIPQAVPTAAYYKPSMDEPPEMILERRNLLRKGSHIEEMHLNQTDTILQWFFKADGPVQFAIFHCAQNLLDFSKAQHFSIKSLFEGLDRHAEKFEMIHPPLKLWPKLVPEHGSICCDKPGYYYIYFANPSRWRRRRLAFHMSTQRNELSIIQKKLAYIQETSKL